MKKEDLKDIKLFVMDMDGTIYLSSTLIEGSLDFIEHLRKNNKGVLFFTNNSSRTGETYVERLNNMGFNVTDKDVMTSGDVTIKYLNTKYKDKKVYLVATPKVTKSFKDAGINLIEEDPDIVVMTFDTTLTYEKLDKACHYIRNGALFLATHLDINCPTINGFMPDCGAMCELITKSTEKKPKYLGKPFKETVDMIVESTGYKREEIAFIGDRIYTDVATGVNNGAKGILVLSGETKEEDIPKFDTTPDLIFDKAYDMIPYIK